MGRRSERLSKQGMLASDLAGEGDVIQVVSRAFDVLRCFEGHEARLGNLEISNRCGLPRSTVSRLTHTLTRMGQLVYLPRDQKYRIGPSAVAMSTSMMKGLQLRNLIRLRLQDVAEHLPGTVGFVIPDRFHLVYLEFARAANALGLHESTGSRISMASTAAGNAYLSALDLDVGDALINEMERETPEAAKLARSRIEANRRHLREHGYVTAFGTWSPHINGCAVPLWSPQYQTYVVVTIGLLSAMYDEKRVHKEVAPRMLDLAAAVGALLEGDGDIFANRLERKSIAVPAHNNKNKVMTEETNGLEAGARRPRPGAARSGTGDRARRSGPPGARLRSPAPIVFCAPVQVLRTSVPCVSLLRSYAVAKDIQEEGSVWQNRPRVRRQVNKRAQARPRRLVLTNLFPPTNDSG